MSGLQLITGNLVISVDLCLGRCGILHHAISKLSPQVQNCYVDNRKFQLRFAGIDGGCLSCHLTDEAPLFDTITYLMKQAQKILRKDF